MSNVVFPTLAGLTWDITATPTFNTRSNRSVSGYEVRTALMAYPLWQFDMAYDILRDNVANNELKTLLGFFNSRLGSYDSFLYNNLSDNAVVSQAFGIGDGATVAFQLLRTYGGFVEPVMNVNGTPSIYINGVLQTTGYTVSSTGLVTFTTAPAVSASLTWSGSYYYRCRFLNDTAQFNQFMQNLWELKQLSFIGSPMNKV